MERQRNQLQFVKDDKTLLPIEEEFLSAVKFSVEKKIGGKVEKILKQYTHPIYDCYLIISNNQPFYLKVNFSLF